MSETVFEVLFVIIVLGCGVLGWKVSDWINKSAIDDFVLSPWELLKRKIKSAFTGALVGFFITMLLSFGVETDNNVEADEETQETTTNNFVSSNDLNPNDTSTNLEINPLPNSSSELNSSENKNITAEITPTESAHPNIEESAVISNSNSTDDTNDVSKSIINHSSESSPDSSIKNEPQSISEKIDSVKTEGKYKVKFRGPFNVVVAKRTYPTEEMKKQAEELWDKDGSILEPDGSITKPQENQQSKGLIPGH